MLCAAVADGNLENVKVQLNFSYMGVKLISS